MTAATILEASLTSFRCEDVDPAAGQVYDFEQEVLENIKEAIAARLWAEDQKAIAGWTPQPGRQTKVVAL